jgi:hypothetical protein
MPPREIAGEAANGCKQVARFEAERLYELARMRRASGAGRSVHSGYAAAVRRKKSPIDCLRLCGIGRFQSMGCFALITGWSHAARPCGPGCGNRGVGRSWQLKLSLARASYRCVRLSGDAHADSRPWTADCVQPRGSRKLLATMAWSDPERGVVDKLYSCFC